MMDNALNAFAAPALTKAGSGIVASQCGTQSLPFASNCASMRYLIVTCKRKKESCCGMPMRIRTRITWVDVEHGAVVRCDQLLGHQLQVARQYDAIHLGSGRGRINSVASCICAPCDVLALPLHLTPLQPSIKSDGSALRMRISSLMPRSSAAGWERKPSAAKPLKLLDGGLRYCHVSIRDSR